VYAMLINSTTVGSEGFASIDMVRFLEDPTVFVFEKNVEFNGFNCLVAGNAYDLVFLSPDLDYSVIGASIYQYGYDENQRTVSYYLYGKSLLSDFVEFDNGVWLPKTIQVFRYDEKGDSTFRKTVKVSQIEVNKEIDDSYFTDFIPDDIFIDNRDTGDFFHYRKGDNLSINDTLKSVIKSKRTWFLQYISLTVGCMLILLVVVAKYIKYLKRKQMS